MTVGGTVLGGLLAFADFLLLKAPLARFVVAVLLAVLGVAMAINGPRLLDVLPYRRGQVPTTWLLWVSRTRTATAWGTMLGTGFATYVDTPAFFAMVLLALLQPTPVWALLVGVTYGMCRGLVLVGGTWLLRKRKYSISEEIEDVGLGLGRTMRAPLTVVTISAGILSLMALGPNLH